MKVLFDHQAFDMQTHGGVSRCFAELYSHRPSSLDVEISVRETDNVYLRDLGFGRTGEIYDRFMGMGNSGLKYVLFKLAMNFEYGYYSKLDRRPRLNLYESVSRLKKQDFDVFHPTFFDGYFLNHIADRPFVITVHDMIPELYPQYYAVDDIQILQKKAVIPKAAHIVTVSEQTKKDLVRMMNIPENKVSVVYHGADEEPYVRSEQVQRDYEYILYVGERHFYKNFASFSRDCIPILKRHRDLKVICTGMPFTSEELYFFDVYGMKDRFVHVFAKTKQELLDLYHDAVAFVYPSEYEGFGIPILEAYRAGCPVMLNRSSCFPEIAGDAAVYFRMNRNTSDFEEQFETLYRMDSNDRALLLDRQKERLKMYSWKKSAQALADVYAGLK
ncbi:MAG: glycosyltransferase family 4 protein [Prevotella sp.]|nr:glycosyltransferase family 4 protein [Prevotella sp.]